MTWNKERREKTSCLIINAVKRQKFHVHSSILLQLLGDFVPQNPTGAVPLNPTGDFRVPDTYMYVHATSEPWLRHEIEISKLRHCHPFYIFLCTRIGL